MCDWNGRDSVLLTAPPTSRLLALLRFGLGRRCHAAPAESAYTHPLAPLSRLCATDVAGVAKIGAGAHTAQAALGHKWSKGRGEKPDRLVEGVLGVIAAGLCNVTRELSGGASRATAPRLPASRTACAAHTRQIYHDWLADERID